MHARLAAAAADWQARKRPWAALLHGASIAEAMQWLAAADGVRRRPTDLQRAYVHASRQFSTRWKQVSGAAVSPNVWVAAACAVVGGCGDGAAIVCNAVLIQRGAPDEVRGRALTLVMGVTYALTAASNVAAGYLLRYVSPRWIWGAAAMVYVVAAVVGYALAREPRAVRATVEPAH